MREKDGMWAVLAWLSVLAHYNQDPSKPLVQVGGGHIHLVVVDFLSSFSRAGGQGFLAKHRPTNKTHQTDNYTTGHD